MMMSGTLFLFGSTAYGTYETNKTNGTYGTDGNDKMMESVILNEGSDKLWKLKLKYTKVAGRICCCFYAACFLLLVEYI